MTATLTAITIPSTSTIPDGTTLANDIITSAAQRSTKRLVQTHGQRNQGQPPRIAFEPRGWTMGGRVD